MNIALIGSGGREHAICLKLKESKKNAKIYCFPGNAGTSIIAENIDINFLNFKKLYKKLKELKVKIVIVGPEEPLVNGITDFLVKKKIKVFGPTKFAAKLEGSKAFMKRICKANKIPTAKFKICKNIKQVKVFLKDISYPVVVKADGLAAGKGVTICKSKFEAIKASAEIIKGKFKNSSKLVMEEFIDGEELSYFSIVDNKRSIFLGSAQDHKKVYEKERGPNTGGMGAYSPSPLLTPDLEKKIQNKIIVPTLSALKKLGHPYKGFLYTGLMIKNNEPHLIEYNVRMGDPECQVILPRLKTNFFDIIDYTLKDKLSELKIKWKNIKCMTIVICTKGYPGKYNKGILIPNLLKIKINRNSKIFHAGTKIVNNQIYSVGGRVLNVNYIGTNFKIIRKNIIKLIKKINWKKGFFRKDIGWRVI